MMSVQNCTSASYGRDVRRRGEYRDQRDDATSTLDRKRMPIPRLGYRYETIIVVKIKGYCRNERHAINSVKLSHSDVELNRSWRRIRSLYSNGCVPQDGNEFNVGSANTKFAMRRANKSGNTIPRSTSS